MRPVVLSASQERGRRTIDSIQYLRGIAAVLVVIFHVFPQLDRMGLHINSPQALSTGVDIFFVISGFVMVYSTSKHTGRGGLAFMRDRVLRIVPLYWMLSLFMLALLLLVPALAQTSRFDLHHVVASFLFVPWMHPVQHKYWPMLVPGWTLNYEMFFYVIFAFALIVSGRRRVIVVGLCCATLLAFALAPLFVPVHGVAEFYTRSMILEFGYGMLLGELFLRTDSAASHVWWIAIAAGACGLAISPWSNQFVTQALAMGVPALLVVGGALYVPLDLTGAWENVARRVGDASYSIYLSHYIMMSAFGQIWRKLVHGGAVSWIGFGIFATVGCVVTGLGIYRFVERPLGRAAKRLLG